MQELRDYQKTCIEFSLKNSSAGLFLDAGLGKSRIILETFHILQEADVVDTLFIIAGRKICKLVWPLELEKWGFEMPVTFLNAPTKQRETNIHDYEPVGMCLITYDLIPWFKEYYGKYAKHLNLGRIMMVIDESSKFKSTGSARFRKLKSILNVFDRRYILSATPMPNHLLDLYAQIYILDGGERLGTKTSFKNNFFVPAGYMGYESKPIENAEPLIFERIKDIAMRFDSDKLNLPALNVVDINLYLGKKVMKAHKELKDELITVLDKNLIDAAHAGVVVNKLRQLTGGAVYQEDVGKNRKWDVYHDDKIGLLKELVEELQGKPLLVAYNFNHEKERLKEAFKDYSPTFFESGASDTRAAKIEQDWNAGKIDLMFGHPASIGHGLNLQGVGAAICFYSLDYNYDTYYQFIKRIYRQGQQHKVFVYRLVARDTIDEQIILNLKKKHKGQTSFLNLLKRASH